ncbi:MAG: hypothetical protein GXP19_06385 [Gammaproteobacteria bacterium]|nr:hypothetical protein [Gammaproteobacteria bacterium]
MLARILIFSFLITGATTNSSADIFSIPNPANSVEGVIRPSRGMTMNEVLGEFGAPLEKKKPVGKPPITRWIYNDFTVNFEGKWVIHSSAIRK